MFDSKTGSLGLLMTQIINLLPFISCDNYMRIVTPNIYLFVETNYFEKSNHQPYFRHQHEF